MKKAMLITLLATGALVLGTSIVKADEVKGRHPIILKLVEKFDLNEDEVAQVFEEYRSESRAERQAKHEENLAQAVVDGVLTEDQKQALETKREEMKPDQGEMRDLSSEERQEAHEAHRSEMETWFESQGIDHEALREYMGGGRAGMGRGR